MHRVFKPSISLRPALLLLTPIAIALLAACTPDNAQSTFGTAGPIAEDQANLFIFIFWIAAVVFVLVEGAVIYVSIRYRRRSDSDKLPHQTHGNTKLEITWTIIPAIILIAVAIPTLSQIWGQQSGVPTDQGEVLNVEAIGHQWWFEFRYPDHEIITANELHIPVDRPVAFKLTSQDVVHIFRVPKIDGKVAMVPLNDNFIWMIGTEPGVFYGQCAEFCGVAHALMRFRVIAEPREDFDAWLLEQAAPAAESTDPLILAGKKVFQQSGCTGCHATDPSSKGRIGPNLTHVASRSTLAGGVFENRDEFDRVNPSILQANLREWLEDPLKAKPANIMGMQAAVYTDSNKKLSEPDISALVAYLSSLK